MQPGEIVWVPRTERRWYVHLSCNFLVNDLGVKRHQTLFWCKILKCRKKKSKFLLASAAVWAAGLWVRE